MRAARHLVSVAWISVCIAVALLLGRAAGPEPREPDVVQVLERVSSRVESFERALAGITVEVNRRAVRDRD